MRTASAIRYAPAGSAKSLRRTTSVFPVMVYGPPNCCHHAPPTLRLDGVNCWLTATVPTAVDPSSTVYAASVTRLEAGAQVVQTRYCPGFKPPNVQLAGSDPLPACLKRISFC